MEIICYSVLVAEYSSDKFTFLTERFQADVKRQWKYVKNQTKSSNSNLNLLPNVVAAE